MLFLRESDVCSSRSARFAAQTSVGRSLRETIVHDPLIAFAPHFCCLHPFRAMRRTVLFVEKFAFHAIGISLHGERPIFQMRQKHRRDADVVIDHLSFGESDFRIKHLVQVRYLNLALFYDSSGLFGIRERKRPASNAQRPTSNCNEALSGKEALGREHRLRFADARDAMLPAFVATEDFDLHPQKINRHFHFRFG